jgi:hypothetical protein
MEKRDSLTILLLALILFSLYLPSLNKDPLLSPPQENTKVQIIENSKICKKGLSQSPEIQATSKTYESQYDLGKTEKYHELACLKSLAATQAKSNAQEKSLQSCNTQLIQTESQCNSYECTSPCKKEGPLILQNCEESSKPKVQILASKYDPVSKKTYCKAQATAFTTFKLSCSCK